MNLSHLPWWSGPVAYVALALAGTMPPKGTKWNAETVYDWFYDAIHVMLNQRPTRGNGTQE